MSQKFRKGDKIICIDAGECEWITEGKIYDADHDQLPDCTYIRIKNDSGFYSSYYLSRFTLHKPNTMQNVPENCEPFDLTEALANPERVVTRDGDAINDLYHFTHLNHQYNLGGVYKGGIMWWTTDGAYEFGKQRQYDLFLRAVERKTYHLIDGTGVHRSRCTSLELSIGDWNCRADKTFPGAIIEYTYTGTRLTNVSIAHRFNEPLK